MSSGEPLPAKGSIPVDKARSLYNSPYKGFKMPGMTLASLKQRYSLIPLFMFVGGGVLVAGSYVLRLATRSLDVAWVQQDKQPWERVGPTHQYKFYSPNIDYSKLKFPEERPDI